MADRLFRFGLVAAPRGSLEDWTATARRAESMGFSTLLAPDGIGLEAAFPALTAAALATETLRVGNFVLAIPYHTPLSIAWNTATLDRFSGGRFELGLGAGRVGMEDSARAVGVPFESPGKRIQRVAEALDAVDGLFGGKPFEAVQQPRPPVMVAGGGTKLLTLAGRRADIVGVHAGSESVLSERVQLLKDVAGDRFDQLELSTNVFHIGDGPISEWVRGFGVDPDKSKNNQAIGVLNGSSATAIDVLKRRRDEFGISYVTVNMAAIDQAAPIVEALTGS